MANVQGPNVRRGIPATAALLGSVQTAAFLGVHKRTLVRLVERGLLAPVARVGFALLFDEEHVAALQRRRKESAWPGRNRKT